MKNKALYGMLLLFVVTIFFLFVLKFSTTNEDRDVDLPPDWYARLSSICSDDFSSQDCLNKFAKVLKDERLWGDVNENLMIGEKAWGDVALNLELLEDDPSEGEFYIMRNNNGDLKPVLMLSSKVSTIPEIFITLNHELVHFANSKKLIETVPVMEEMVEGCINKYQKVVLLDESKAFKSELRFYKTAPKWFKNLLKPIRFNSKFSGLKDTSYEAHYDFISKKLKEDFFWGSKRYVNLGQYPVCALDLLDSL